MGIWIETGVFLLVLAFGLWQIHDVKKERRKRSQSKSVSNPTPSTLQDPVPHPSSGQDQAKKD